MPKINIDPIKDAMTVASIQQKLGMTALADLANAIYFYARSHGISPEDALRFVFPTTNVVQDRLRVLYEEIVARNAQSEPDSPAF